MVYWQVDSNLLRENVSVHIVEGNMLPSFNVLSSRIVLSSEIECAAIYWILLGVP